MNGHYGVKIGAIGTPGNLPTSFTSIFKALNSQTSNVYVDAYIDKWDMSHTIDDMHPSDHGIDHFERFFNSNVDDYYNWEKVTNGVTSNEIDLRNGEKIRTKETV